MKIENIKVNSFGKLKDKEINLSNGINIIYGKNEAGKSTLLKFIQNIFYGTSKNKKGKIFSDYDLYKPWEDEDFSGKITYKLDSGKKYEVFREFGKKNPKIYNEQLENITKEFSINKNTGSEFFYEQTKVDEFMFLSSIVSMQQDVKLNVQEQNVYIQKIANLASTGDDNVSLKKAIDKLNKKQLEEIGTDRSQGKPINIVKSEILEYETKLQELEKFNKSKFEIEEKEETISKEIEKIRVKSKFIKELKEIKQNENLELEKINLNEQIKEKNNAQIKEMEDELQELENKKDVQTKQKKEIEKTKLTPYAVSSLICAVIGISAFIIINNIFILVAIGIIIASIIGVYLFTKNKVNKQIEEQKSKKQKINSEINEQKNILKNKIELIKKNNEEIDNTFEQLNNKLDMELDLKKENLKARYLNNINLDEINKLIDLEAENLNIELNLNEEAIHKKELNLNMISLEKKQTLESLEELVNIEEKLENAKQEYEELIIKNGKINKAKEYIIKAYEKMKNGVTPKFTANLSNIIEKISNGKYNKVFINDTEGMVVGLPNGEYVSAEKLSTGTIEQLYLALRLSMAKEISKENMPIILDEAFAYYDDERLENTLKFLLENFKENQIIIFTCTHREEKVLDNNCYNLIKLEKTVSL